MRTKRAAQGADLYSGPYYRDGGAHSHELDEHRGLSRGGQHRHVWRLDGGVIAISDLDGSHQHTAGSDLSGHDHVVAVVAAQVELHRSGWSGSHGHETLFWSSTYSGGHAHDLAVGGKTYRSLSADELYALLHDESFSFEAIMRSRPRIARAIKKGPLPATIVPAPADSVTRSVKWIKRSDSDRGLRYGVVLSPHSFDTYDTWFDPETIERAAHQWMEKSRLIDRDHEKLSETAAIECFVEPYPTKDDYEKAHRNEPHTITERPYGDDIIRSGEWVIGVRLCEDDLAAEARGDLTAFSINGVGKSHALKADEGPPQTTVIKLAAKVD